MNLTEDKKEKEEEDGRCNLRDTVKHYLKHISRAEGSKMSRKERPQPRGQLGHGGASGLTGTRVTIATSTAKSTSERTIWSPHVDQRSVAFSSYHASIKRQENRGEGLGSKEVTTTRGERGALVIHWW
ncbi:hypothetical protein CDL15_Pgr018690 [Punica granatum]|nr:hypothetical protein CDL15_Pgr018690 [Punica granatum]